MRKIRVVILGQGLVATHFAIGLERIKLGEIEPHGVPFAKYKLSYSINDIDIVGSYDVDEAKINRTVYDVARDLVGKTLRVPETLKDINVLRGLHFRSLEGLPFKARGLDDVTGPANAIEKFIESLEALEPDVVLNLITTEHGEPFMSFNNLEAAFKSLDPRRLSASQCYAYAVAEYSRRKKKNVVFVNAIPSPLANDDAFVYLYEQLGSLLLGDDGATGATPLTADLLEHLAERNRRVEFIAQFNIGGNTDFLALTLPEKNIMKEKTKSSIVEDILGYNVPHYIKPTGYLEPLGDKKYVAMHFAWKTFNELEDELFISMRINDSPALAGLLVDLVRIGKALTDKGIKGTAYIVNAFFMKNPGPSNMKNIARIIAFHRLREWLASLGVLKS